MPASVPLAVQHLDPLAVQHLDPLAVQHLDNMAITWIPFTVGTSLVFHWLKVV